MSVIVGAPLVCIYSLIASSKVIGSCFTAFLYRPPRLQEQHSRASIIIAEDMIVSFFIMIKNRPAPFGAGPLKRVIYYLYPSF